MSSGTLDTKSSNKTIAINTIVVYARLFITTIIGLITSRYVLQVLGVSDFGLYNVVGGVIALFSVISGSLSTTTIRFLNVEIGKKDGNPNRIFNICNVVHICFALILLALAETIGVFYINNYLNVEPGKEADAMFVFQVSTVVACLGLINVPYQSTFIAKEKFMHIAWVDITNAIIKLISVLCLLKYTGNVLCAYALLMSLTTLFSFVVYHGLSYKKWPELVKWHFVSHKKDYKQVLVYNNYNILAAVSLIARSQGSNMLINFFFGTVVNGAYAIARTVQGFVDTFMTNFDAAAAPRILQNVGAGEKSSSENLVYKVARYCILIMCLVFFPLMSETEYVLRLWLGSVPEYSVVFTQLLLVVILVSSTAGGMLQYINASDKIKWFKIQSCFWSIIVIPLGFVMFKYGWASWWIFVLFIISDILNRAVQLYLMHRLLQFDSIAFMKSAYMRPLAVISTMSMYLILYNLISIENNFGHILGLLVTVSLSASSIFLLGLTDSERKQICNFLKTKLNRKLWHL